MVRRICLVMLVSAVALVPGSLAARGMDGTLEWGLQMGPGFGMGDLSDLVDIGFVADTFFSVRIVGGFGVRVTTGYGTYQGSMGEIDNTITEFHFLGEALYDFSQSRGMVHPYVSGGMGFMSAELQSEVPFYDGGYSFTMTYSDQSFNFLGSLGGGCMFGPFGQGLYLRTDLDYRHVFGNLSVESPDQGVSDPGGGFLAATVGIVWEF